MSVVLLVAVDFAIVRALWDTNGPQVGIAIFTLPMVSLLTLALPHLRANHAARPFWLGFELIGGTMVAFVAFVAWFHPHTFFWPMSLIERNIPQWHEEARLGLSITCGVLLYTTPQLLAALIAGWLSGRYRVILERR